MDVSKLKKVSLKETPGHCGNCGGEEDANGRCARGCLDAGAEVMTVDEFAEQVRLKMFCPDDGDGYWIRDGVETEDNVWFTPPDGATGVAWYNK